MVVHGAYYHKGFVARTALITTVMLLHTDISSGEDFSVETNKVSTSAIASVEKKLQDVPLWIDSLISRDRAAYERNTSLMKIESRATIDETENIESGIRIKARVSLPKTSKKLKLIFDSNPDELESIDGQARPISTDSRLDDDKTVAGFELTKKNDWRHSLRLSTRLKSGVNFIPRLRSSQEYSFINDLYKLYLQQDIWYEKERGWSESSRIRNRFLRFQPVELQTISQVKYIDQRFPWEFTHQWVMLKPFSTDAMLDCRIGHILTESDQGVIRDHFYAIAYKKRLPETKFIYGIVFESFFEEAANWSAFNSLTVKLDYYLFQ